MKWTFGTGAHSIFYGNDHAALVVNAILHYTSCPEAANEFGRDWVVRIVKDVVRDMVTNGELQAVSQPTSPKSESPTLAADDLADLGGVMGMFRSKE